MSEKMLEKVKELGLAIIESDEIKRMKTAEEIQESDAAAQALIKKYNDKRILLVEEVQGREVTQEKLSELKEILNKEFEVLLTNDIIVEFIEAKKAFDEMIKNMNDVLKYYITGEEVSDSDGCGGKCSSCSGCK